MVCLSNAHLNANFASYRTCTFGPAADQGAKIEAFGSRLRNDRGRLRKRPESKQRNGAAHCHEVLTTPNGFVASRAWR